ncbi:MAG: PA2169 family four-helix-bundle protein [Balneolaceae bacterium]
MEQQYQESIETYNNLIRICADGKEGYEHAAKNVEDPTMQMTFRRFAQERAQFMEQLQEQVAQLEGEPEHEGSVTGSLHRSWMDIKAALTSGNEESIIRACITGEESAISEYEAALKDTHMTPAARQVIAEQYSKIKQALATIKAYTI